MQRPPLWQLNDAAAPAGPALPGSPAQGLCPTHCRSPVSLSRCRPPPPQVRHHGGAALPQPFRPRVAGGARAAQHAWPAASLPHILRTPLARACIASMPRPISCLPSTLFAAAWNRADCCCHRNDSQAPLSPAACRSACASWTARLPQPHRQRRQQPRQAYSLPTMPKLWQARGRAVQRHQQRHRVCPRHLPKRSWRRRSRCSSSSYPRCPWRLRRGGSTIPTCA